MNRGPMKQQICWGVKVHNSVMVMVDHHLSATHLPVTSDCSKWVHYPFYRRSDLDCRSDLDATVHLVRYVLVYFQMLDYKSLNWLSIEARWNL